MSLELLPKEVRDTAWKSISAGIDNLFVVPRVTITAAEPSDATEPDIGELKAPTPRKQPYSIVLFYQYTPIPDTAAFRAWQEELCHALGLTGRVLIGEEGVNGSLGGSVWCVSRYISEMERQYPCFRGVDWKRSISTCEPFPDLKISVVKEIISTGGKIRPPKPNEGGVHLSPAEFHAALAEPNTVVIDVRNKNEFEIGHLDKAVNPNTRTFAEFPRFIENNLESLQGKKVLMYCTGGIRCEKASLFLKDSGLTDVYQLNGGIHRYIEAFPDGGKFVGKNVVFDRRGQVPTTNATVIGHCIVCAVPYDSFQGDRVCTVCRDPLLVCGECKVRQRGVFYCDNHDYLKGSYYYFLEGFAVPELHDQLSRLQMLHTSLLAGTGKETHKKKNQRKTITKQIDKVKAEIERLEALPTPEVIDLTKWRFVWRKKKNKRERERERER